MIRDSHSPRRPGMALLALALMGTAGAVAASPDDSPFLAANHAAMAKMMAAMDIKPSGDVDADFVAMMVPHHQGAIDMAKVVLQYGKDDRVRKLAQDIIRAQEAEIAQMRTWLDAMKK